VVVDDVVISDFQAMFFDCNDADVVFFGSNNQLRCSLWPMDWSDLMVVSFSVLTLNVATLNALVMRLVDIGWLMLLMVFCALWLGRYRFFQVSNPSLSSAYIWALFLRFYMF
jgi:hypothetical protein